MSAHSTATRQLAEAEVRIVELRYAASAEARAVRATLHALALTAETRGRVLYHLDHAERYGAAYSVAIALKILREGA